MDSNLRPALYKSAALPSELYRRNALRLNWRKVEDSNPYAIASGSFQDCSRTDSGYLPLVPHPRLERGILAVSDFKSDAYTSSANVAL